jgi:hypothetical protein
MVRCSLHFPASAARGFRIISALGGAEWLARGYA